MRDDTVGMALDGSYVDVGYLRRPLIPITYEYRTLESIKLDTTGQHTTRYLN